MKKFILIIFFSLFLLSGQEDSEVKESRNNTIADSLKNSQIQKKLIENIFDGRNLNVETVISGDDPEIKGFISNIQTCPFYNKLLSFEVTTLNDQSTKLVLYNTESQFLLHISPIEDYENNIKSIPFPVKDRGVKWHPHDNYFIFQSNGYMNRDQLFMVKLNDKYLMSEDAVNIQRIELKEPAGTINQCLDPEFNSNGEDLYFTVRIQKEDKNSKYNKYNNIAWVKDIFRFEKDGFTNIDYEIIFNKRYDQKKVVCSPSDPDVFAFISYNKDFEAGYGYADYSLVIHDKGSNKTEIIERMNGFRDYPYQWSPSGDKLFYTKAMSLSLTPRDFRDDRINKINLHAADIVTDPDKITVTIEKNENSDIVMGDVATKEYGISFVDDDTVLMAKYDPYESIFMIDMKKWRLNEGFYVKQLPIPQENDFPVLTKEYFYFLRYDYYQQAVVSTICRIPYVVKVDKEALRRKKERRAKRAAKKAQQENGE